MTRPVLVGAGRIPPQRPHAAFGAAFADDLIGPLQLPLAPWPLFLGRQGRPGCASRRLGTMGALPADGRVQVNRLVDRGRAQQDAQALVTRLLAHGAGKPVQVAQLQRQAVGGAALERLGFERLPLHQLWMRHPS